MDAADLAGLARYLEWADRRVWAALAGVPADAWQRPLASSHGSLGATVEHLAGTEWTWLRRVEGESPPAIVPPGGARDRAALEALWPAVWAGWAAAAAALPPEARIAYRTTGGAPCVTAFGDILLHVSHHSAAYRGQVAALQRQLGFQPAATDLIAHLRESGRP